MIWVSSSGPFRPEPTSGSTGRSARPRSRDSAAVANGTPSTPSSVRSWRRHPPTVSVRSASGTATARRPRRAVAVPEALLTETVGGCRRQDLTELGVEGVPFATAALSRLRGRADLPVLPLVGSGRKGPEELTQIMQQLQDRVQTDLGRLPRIIPFSLDGDHRAICEAFARIGLTFTRRVERLRHAYVNAVETIILPSGQLATAPEAAKSS